MEWVSWGWPATSTKAIRLSRHLSCQRSLGFVRGEPRLQVVLIARSTSIITAYGSLAQVLLRDCSTWLCFQTREACWSSWLEDRRSSRLIWPHRMIDVESKWIAQTRSIDWVERAFFTSFFNAVEVFRRDLWIDLTHSRWCIHYVTLGRDDVHANSWTWAHRFECSTWLCLRSSHLIVV